jgi:hypothetical protein
LIDQVGEEFNKESMLNLHKQALHLRLAKASPFASIRYNPKYSGRAVTFAQLCCLVIEPFVRCKRKVEIMNPRWIFFALCIVVLSACGPSQVEIEQTVQASIAQTERARPTATTIPTNTMMPTATATATPFPSPTPDTRIIDADPRDLLLEKSDLPADGKYVLPGPRWISPLTNAEIVASWTVEEGQAYLAETGRIDGWWVAYRQGSNQVVMPQEVYDNAVIYTYAEGAQLIVTKYGDEYVEDMDLSNSLPRELAMFREPFRKARLTQTVENKSGYD